MSAAITLPDDPAELAAYIAELTVRVAARPPWEHLEELFTSPRFFGIDASPLQRAICRIADGRPLEELAHHPDVIAAVGTAAAIAILTSAPFELVILAGIRGGKSLLAAAWCLHVSQIVDVSQCSPGDMPRVACVSVRLDQARAVYDHLVGNMRAKPELRALLVSDPTDSTTRALVRHPTGRTIEICTAAGARGGQTLVARWLAGVVFDEFALMAGEADGAAVNWDEQRKAVRNRILPGGGIWNIGSPWSPVGPAYTMCKEHFGAPIDGTLVVIKAASYRMNPSWWTPERCAKAKEEDPDAYEMTVEANFGTPPAAMYADSLLTRSTRAARSDLPLLPVARAATTMLEHVEQHLEARRFDPDGEALYKEALKHPFTMRLDTLGDYYAEDAEPIPGAHYAAAIDPATRGNAWTLVIVTRVAARLIIACAREWRGTRDLPLDPRVVLRDIARCCKRYGVTSLESDQWAGDLIASHARDVDLAISPRMGDTTEEIFARYKRFRERLEMDLVELPPLAALGADLRRVQRRTTTRGFTVILPVTSDGRHCDFAPAIVLAADRFLRDVAPPPPEPGTPAALEAEADAMRAQRTREMKKKQGPVWFQRAMGRLRS